MKFVLAGLGNFYSRWELISRAVPEAEQLGYWGFVMPDHYMWASVDPTYSGASGGDSTLETWITLTHLAARTKRIRLGTLVTPIPLRPPSVLAKMVSTLDLVSNGRTMLGVGAGWSQTEFEGYSEWDEPKVRVDKTHEGLRLILKLWTEETVSFRGKYYHAKNAVLHPKPLQKPHPPLIFGSSRKRMLRLAARYADICFIPPGTEPSTNEVRDMILDHARQSGRTTQLSFATGAPEAYRSGYFGPYYKIERYKVKVEEAEKDESDYFIVAFPQETYEASMKDFAENILPSFGEC